MAKTKPGEWGQQQLAALMGTNAPHFGRMLNGVEYPTIAMMQKFEVVFEWPVVEQVQLLRYMWEEPDQRYAMVLRQHILDWAKDNPRTVGSQDVRMHPKLVARHNTGKKLEAGV